MEAAPFAVTSPFCDVPASAPGPKIPEEGSEVTSFVHQHWCQHMFKVTLILEPWVRKTPQINEQTTEINLLSPHTNYPRLSPGSKITSHSWGGPYTQYWKMHIKKEP